MRRFEAGALALTLAIVAGCGSDNPAGPGTGNDPGPTELVLQTFQAADLVIGQADMISGLADAGGTTNAVGLRSPYSTGDGAFYLPDAGNNRVLGFAGFPAANGAAASFVIGQDDLASSQGGISDRRLSNPTNCAVDGGRLFVVDAGNNRVLIWNSLPTGNVPADVVVGQPDFATNTAATTASGFHLPWAIAVSDGRLFVADAQNHRVLVWNAIPATSGVPADIVVGQPDFTSGAYGLSASRIGRPYTLWTDGTRLAVGDNDNRRVLIWNALPATNGAPADVVLGEPDFDTADMGPVNATSLWCPSGIASDGSSLFVADCGLNRVLVFSPFPTENNVAPTAVLGQGDFTRSAPDDDDQDGQPDGHPTARTLASPEGIRVSGDRLLVADQDNQRILVFTGGPR